MISSPSDKRVEINITTYKYNIAKDMTEDRIERRYHKNNTNRYICSICLNRKPSKEDYKKVESDPKSKSCPICQKNYNENNNKLTDKNQSDNISNVIKYKHGKNIQTSQPDITQGMTLLNEVLTVFQNKKQTDTNKDKSKTTIFKDASVNTEGRMKVCPKLSFSKVFYCSIVENSQTDDNKFIIISSQPEASRTSQFSMDLINRKSSSIPQMKLEELKKSLKEKTKSKDTIEEVNRMFASVRKYEISQNVEITNRPSIRNGPRVLPVVKTTIKDAKSPRPKNCRNCQNKMSSGDSSECCHSNEQCENCFYMMCHYQQRLYPGAACSSCRNKCEQKNNTNV